MPKFFGVQRESKTKKEILDQIATLLAEILVAQVDEKVNKKLKTKNGEPK